MSDRDRRLCELMGIPIKKGGAIILKTDDTIEEDLHEYVPDFSTPEWRARLMDWATEQEWWEAFYRKTWREWYRKQDAWSVSREAKYIVYLWRNLPDLLVEYHGEER